MTAKIKLVHAREILDSRGNPTLETAIGLTDGSFGIASVPSGTSKGKHEALELRDNDRSRFGGLGVLKAVANVNENIFPLIRNLQADKQTTIDQLMIDLDGSDNKSNLGANAILSVSQALVKASAESLKLPVYNYLQKLYGLRKKFKLPKPIFNLLNAGKHGSSRLEFQEFHLIPARQKSFRKNLEVGERVYQKVKEILIKLKLSYAVGDEGGYSPNLLSNLDGFEVLKKAVRQSGLQLGENAYLGLDASASNFYEKGKYRISDFARAITAKKLTEFYFKLGKRFHLRYLEDPLEEDAWQDWQNLRQSFSKTKLKIVGDDLLCTNPERLKIAIESNACSAILIKPNQIGTITETVQVIKIAKESGFKIIVSHRSGETNDDFLADFAVGVEADMVKFGAPARGERVVKYNRLLKIEEEVKEKTSFSV